MNFLVQLASCLVFCRQCEALLTLPLGGSSPFLAGPPGVVAPSLCRVVGPKRGYRGIQTSAGLLAQAFVFQICTSGFENEVGDSAKGENY